jgi:GNAT superfamily N-acetyltransferase
MTLVATFDEAINSDDPLVHYRADESDWMALVALRLAAERRLRQLSSSQWTDTARGLEQMWQYLERDEMYVIRHGPQAAGCFALTDRSDPEFWSGDPERRQFLYLHKVIVTPDMTGAGVGAYIVAQTMSDAEQRGCLGARLRCWTGNDRLRAVWERHGFTYLRTVPVPGSGADVLMERRLVCQQPA